VKTGQPQATASYAVAVGGPLSQEPAPISISDARADFKRRLSLISRRRQRARVRGVGRIVGWSAGTVALLGLVSAAVVGLR
jgi:hypothetical protein